MGAGFAILSQVEGEAGITAVLAGCVLPHEVFCTLTEGLYVQSQRRLDSASTDAGRADVDESIKEGR